mgnify:FL=1|jgi:hypothetical protein|tara:strand:+ start:3166 stop:3411 length:246 start_codon:yes stop_codon:yes gene_type:complete
MMNIEKAAHVLVSMSVAPTVTANERRVDNLRRPTSREVSKGCPAHFWVEDIVRPNGRKDKKYYPPNGGRPFRSMLQAAASC